MSLNRKIIGTLGFCALLAAGSAASADIIVSEVHPTGSSTGSGHYNNDWFELTNTGASDVDITGWKMDDNSNLFANSVALNLITSIPAGKSVVFVETSNNATLDLFKTDWFGLNIPADFLIGRYNGSNVSLSSSSDAVNIYNGSGTLITNVSFGASTTGVTFDNAAGLTGPISTLSSNGVNGAFVSPGTSETGSPGVIANAVPEPASLGILVVGAAAILTRKRK